MPRKDRTWPRREWARRKAENLCVDCGKQQAVSPLLRCIECTQQRRVSVAIWQKQRRIKRKERGVCERCGKHVSQDGFRMCRDCRAQRKMRYETVFRSKRIAAHKGAVRRLKHQIFEAYGGAHCVCCKEAHIEFLSIDHIAGGGLKERRKVNRWGNSFYRWLKLRGFPPGYRVLCMNCNTARGWYGYCPHEQVKL